MPSDEDLVPSAGLEPARPCELRILSPVRLPIPSRGHHQTGVANLTHTCHDLSEGIHDKPTFIVMV